MKRVIEVRIQDYNSEAQTQKLEVWSWRGLFSCFCVLKYQACLIPKYRTGWCFQDSFIHLVVFLLFLPLFLAFFHTSAVLLLYVLFCVRREGRDQGIANRQQKNSCHIHVKLSLEADEMKRPPRLADNGAKWGRQQEQPCHSSLSRECGCPGLPGLYTCVVFRRVVWLCCRQIRWLVRRFVPTAAILLFPVPLSDVRLHNSNDRAVSHRNMSREKGQGSCEISDWYMARQV